MQHYIDGTKMQWMTVRSVFQWIWRHKLNFRPYLGNFKRLFEQRHYWKRLNWLDLLILQCHLLLVIFSVGKFTGYSSNACGKIVASTFDKKSFREKIRNMRSCTLKWLKMFWPPGTIIELYLSHSVQYLKCKLLQDSNGMLLHCF